MGTEDVATTTNTLLTSGILGRILGTDGALIKDGASKLGVRCGLLNLLPDPDTNNEALCLAGTLASANDFAALLGDLGDPLGNTLGLDRFDQLPSYQTATKAQLEAWKLEASRQGNYFATVGNGAPCLPAVTTQTSVVYIGKVASGLGNEHCTISAATPGRTAAVLVVEEGGIDVIGDNVATNYPGGSTENPTFTGVLYAANRGAPQPAGTGSTLIRLSNRGWVRGAIFADGAGKVSIDPPNVNVTQSLLCTVLGIPQGLLCTLAGTLDGLLNQVLGSTSLTNSLVTALLPVLNTYTAVERNTDAIDRAKPKLPTSANIGSGTFRQIAPN